MVPRGEMYRPVKKPVTMRLDADVIHWLKSQGPGYQTKANRLLRAKDAALVGTLREAPAVVRDMDCAKARRARNRTSPARVGAFRTRTLVQAFQALVHQIPFS